MRWLVLALLLMPAAAQPAPSLVAAWEPGGLRVVWSGAPDEVCLYLDSTPIPDACGPAGRVVLPAQGVDVAYRPDPGDVLRLRFDTTQAAFVEAVVPMHLTWMPVVVAP